MGKGGYPFVPGPRQEPPLPDLDGEVIELSPEDWEWMDAAAEELSKQLPPPKPKRH